MRGSALVLVALVAGCTNPRLVAGSLQKTQASLVRANEIHARACAPRELAQATSNLAFARLEFTQGDVRRASEHLALAQAAAALALEVAGPCGTADRDGDGVADVVDRCPDEVEDLDGDRDGDGCRDIDPDDDEDMDGIANIDDACVDTPEDMDGDADDDGCPETSVDSDGDQVVDTQDRCPAEAEDADGWEDEDGCPDPDNDLDGIPDLLDACPTVKEDVDGWNDDDGCPDPDNDGDGVPDKTDRCPDEPGDRARDGCPLDDADQDGIADANDRCPGQPETRNGYLDTDGCPDIPPTRVRVTTTRIELLEPLSFTSGTADISEGKAALDEVARVLADDPTLRLRIEGHTDSQGDPAANLELSERRAGSVRVYLVRLGVAAERLQAQGFGAQRPIDTNRTEAGRTRNRRVELVLVPVD
jgi:outer membrane protein OmpA-like peptidoglycan-associated protein